MKKMTKLAVTLLAGVVISACGSSGGSSSPAKPKTPKADAPKAEAPKAEAPKAEAPEAEAPKAEAPKAEAPKAEAPKAEAPKAEAPKAEAPKAEAPKAEAPKAEAPKSTVGGAFIVEGASNNRPELSKAQIQGTDLSSITVDGITINFMDTAKEGLKACCDKYSAVRFGVDDSHVGKDYSFYTGYETKDMPTTGKFSYEGDAYLLAAIAEDGKDFGTSKFEADFGAKKLTGTLTFDKLATNKDIKVDSQISGNSFAGTATFGKYAPAVVEGKFFGENAKELAGVFDSAPEVKGDKPVYNSRSGAFGAVKK
ncbi:Slam-dependent surface lipoprotein [Actinobacillus equuli]|uniref:Slam-dependent surface lipoprotein n=1 Tax=Actinobacillus equuli TaxID=718 RepID=UPI002442DEEB|nr:Slam-dependent surface lipoprotein [Actinobacillus equuli]WGE75575.1 transferrin-binding protein-like solute binding protein [Actinobacillus equuli subsp. haemolyticus]WGE77474.1 transferrin-binding protein-like solute binding protein [Actinobacillus equuli subsp. haemolyticus]